MTDDLKERLLELCNGPPNATIPWPHRVIHDALAHITDLEARLAAAEAEVQRIKEINVAHCRTVNTLLVCESRMETRAKAAEAGVMNHKITQFQGQTGWLVRAHHWGPKGYSSKTFSTASEATGWLRMMDARK